MDVSEMLNKCPCKDSKGVCIAVHKPCEPLAACVKILVEPLNLPLKKVYIVLDSGGIWEG
jgi:hypothetical protein